MKRYARDRRDGGEPRRPQTVELSEKNKRLRLIAVVVFVLIAAAAFAFGVLNMNAPNAGWSVISSNVTGSGEFSFSYDFGKGGLSARAVQREITELYSETLSRCRMLFSTDEDFEDTVNIRTINANPNTELSVEPLLYNALELLAEENSRLLYSQPIRSRYSGIFGCASDREAADFDPLLNPEIKEEYKRTGSFASDRDHIRLELLGDNKVRLFVSDMYLKYAAEEGITEFIGLSRLKNAFIVDAAAETMREHGFTRGIIASYDGYTANLDSSGAEYALNIFDRRENVVYQAAVMRYSGAMSIVSLRDYPLNPLDGLRFYETESGEIRTPYIGFDGVSRTAISSLTCYSRDKGCAELALRAEEVYTMYALDIPALKHLESEGIYSVWCSDLKVHCGDENVSFGSFYADERVSYSRG